MLSSLLRSQAKSRAQHDVERSIAGARLRSEEREDFFGQAWEEVGKGASEEATGKGKATENSPLLPIFSATQLDSIPVYTLVHAIRAEIIEKVDTTLTWDQLRSPQVSQFLVKPILAKLEQPPVSKGVLYSLMANCLQFNKEAQENPGNASVYQTRSMLTELLALKLLREFSTLELIDCLSYDFYPLQGLPTEGHNTPMEGSSRLALRRQPVTRVSTLEIAVRAQAKKFLSHPLVIQQLDAIWSGQIVFHSETERNYRQFGRMTWSRGNRAKAPEVVVRRTATLYEVQQAGVLKLSRLRVPRYRHVTSTFSLGVLLILYCLVLQEREANFTSLEAVFWAWSFGFMMDEISGLSEKGLALHMISLWNAFDVLIYVLFLAFYIMRLMSIFLSDPNHKLSELSYDVLASAAIFLFPRIFSVLDHFEYFSQLIIGFKSMAVDLMAILLLIVIACSGFFVAFTLAFGRNLYSGGVVAFALFQILMGFTPTAWESWHKYDLLGKVLLTIFLFITHYLIFTLLVTVLTNSFAEVIKNAHEEHHFLVAANTLSLVKSENMFSYVAPFNLIGYLILPLRSILPFTFFVRINRVVIQLIHFPILLLIFIYERTLLVNNSFESIDSIRNQRAAKLGLHHMEQPLQRRASVFGTVGMRPESMDSGQQQMLEEVFRRPMKFHGRNKGDGNAQGGLVKSWVEGVVGATATGGNAGKNRLRPFQRFDSEEGARYGFVDRAEAFSARPPFMERSASYTPLAREQQTKRSSRAPSRVSQAGLRRRRNKSGSSSDDGDDERPKTGKQHESGDESEGAEFAFASRINSPKLGPGFQRVSGFASPRGPGSWTPRGVIPSQSPALRHTSRPSSIRSRPPIDDSTSEAEAPNPYRQPFAFHPANANLTTLSALNQLSSSLGPTLHPAPPPTTINPLSAFNTTFHSAPNLFALRSSPGLSDPLDDFQDHAAGSAQRDTILSSSFETQIANARGGDEILGRIVLERIGNLERGFEGVREVLEDVRELSFGRRERREGEEREGERM